MCISVDVCVERGVENLWINTAVTTSLLLTAIQRDAVCVDKNLFGVSSQVTAPGVLAFRHIFLTLRPGEDTRPQTPAE